jgi:hypothetical protein
LIDGIDNQAPGLNFAVGSIVGPTSLDADNIELFTRRFFGLVWVRRYEWYVTYK